MARFGDPTCPRCDGPCTGLCEESPAARRITELEERVRHAEAELALTKIALNHVGRGIQMIDAAGWVVVANELAGALTGVPASFLASRPHVDDVVAMQWQNDEFSNTPPQLRVQFHSPMATSQMQTYRRLRPNGRVVEVETVCLPDGGLVRTHTDVTERHEAEQRVAYLANHDSLTGLANRVYFHESLAAALASGSVVAVLLIDVDRFKEINDAFGHPAGDAFLKELAARLHGSIRATDLAARLGGDEFCIILTPLHHEMDAEAFAARLIAAAAQPFTLLGQQVLSGVSVGISVSYPEARRDNVETHLDELLRQTDIALYAAKLAGRGKWRTFDPALQERLLADQAMLVELHAAIAGEQFEVFYQPVVDLQSSRVSAFEALLRWHHPDRGLLEAGDFIPAAEASGLIVQIGSWVLQQACRDAITWPEHVRVLVNFSPKQLGNPDLFDRVKNALDSNGLAPSRLEIEITETSLLQMSDAMTVLMRRLRTLGILIGLDDFGTGFSSLSHLRLFSFDTIKIDRSFVTDATRRSDSGAIVRAVTSLAWELQMRTIAEGVEDIDQLAFLWTIGCDEVQGFIFDRPRPASDVPIMLTSSVAPLATLAALTRTTTAKTKSSHGPTIEGRTAATGP